MSDNQLKANSTLIVRYHKRQTSHLTETLQRSYLFDILHGRKTPIVTKQDNGRITALVQTQETRGELAVKHAVITENEGTSPQPDKGIVILRPLQESQLLIINLNKNYKKTKTKTTQ